MTSFRDATNIGNITISLKSLASITKMSYPVSVINLIEVLKNYKLPKIEGLVGIVDETFFTRIDVPEIKIRSHLINVFVEWNNNLVPQETSRENKSWRINNGDIKYGVWNGDEDLDINSMRAGSYNGEFYAWPSEDGEWSAENNPELEFSTRSIRVGYKPISLRLKILKPKNGLAENSSEQFKIALDPEILLVPVEVIRFFSNQIPNKFELEDQLLLWDQIPTVGSTKNLINTDGNTGEIRFTAREWNFWPKKDNDGLYNYNGWISPGSIWGKAGIKFRLVNYIEIETDNEHVAPTRKPGVFDDQMLRENNSLLEKHPKHISDKPVLKVIIMFRIHPPDSVGIDQGLIGLNSIGISWGLQDRYAIIAHEIGHIILNSQIHSNLPNNVMNSPGPGTDISQEQAEKARIWASNFQSFWMHP